MGGVMGGVIGRDFLPRLDPVNFVKFRAGV